MTERSRFDRAWPSLVALFGTVAVVLGLLWVFGGEVDPSGDDLGAEMDFEDDGAFDDGADDGADDGDAGADDDSGTDDEDAASPDPDQTGPPSDPVTAPPELRSPVGVLNSTSVAGLAASAQQRFTDGGWSVPATGNYSQPIEASTIYYPSGMQQSAEAFRAQFPEIGRVEPTIAGLAQDRLVVILADDFVSAVDEGG